MMPLPGSGSRSERLRFIAGGIGITPILPMVRLADRVGMDWSLRYTGRHRDSLPFLEELEGFGDRVRVLTDDVSGLPTAADLLDDVTPWTAVYACGPPPMMDLVRAGAPERCELHIEAVLPGAGGGRAPVRDGVVRLQVMLSRSGPGRVRWRRCARRVRT